LLQLTVKLAVPVTAVPEYAGNFNAPAETVHTATTVAATLIVDVAVAADAPNETTAPRVSTDTAATQISLLFDMVTP
jgi:hypothetical protein